MSVVQNFEQLVKFLNDNKVPNKVDVERQVIEMPSKGAPLPGNLYVKWEKSVPFIQIIHFMIESVPADRVREVETAVVRLDNQLEVGGFGFDHSHNRLYVRLTVPVFPSDGLNPMTLNQLGHGVVRNCKEFLEAFQEVIGGKPGADIVSIYEAIVLKRKAATSGAQA
jgi:hypothetical protein